MLKSVRFTIGQILPKFTKHKEIMAGTYNKITRKIMERVVTSKIGRRRPRRRWLEVEMSDLRSLRVENWDSLYTALFSKNFHFVNYDRRQL